MTEERVCRGPCARSLPSTTEYFAVERYRKQTREPVLSALCRDCRKSKRAAYYQEHKEEERRRCRERYNTRDAYDPQRRARKTAISAECRKRRSLEKARAITDLVIDAYAHPNERAEFADKFYGGCREAEVVEARSVAIYVMRRCCWLMTWEQIGSMVHMDHSSAIVSYRRARRTLSRCHGRPVKNKAMRLAAELVMERCREMFA